jgi:thiamine biosynthesis lipoprotein ApbE
LLGQGIATSGSYEQFIEIDGVRYTHIIDPRSGLPVGGVDSVTVVGPSAAWCDLLSTAIFVEGPELIGKAAAVQANLNVLFIDLKEGEEAEVQRHGPLFEGLQLQLD